MTHRTAASLAGVALLSSLAGVALLGFLCVSDDALARGGARVAGARAGGHAVYRGGTVRNVNINRNVNRNVYRGAYAGRYVGRRVAVGAAAVGVAGVAAAGAYYDGGYYGTQCGYFPYPPCSY